MNWWVEVGIPGVVIPVVSIILSSGIAIGLAAAERRRGERERTEFRRETAIRDLVNAVMMLSPTLIDADGREVRESEKPIWLDMKMWAGLAVVAFRPDYPEFETWVKGEINRGMLLWSDDRFDAHKRDAGDPEAHRDPHFARFALIAWRNDFCDHLISWHSEEYPRTALGQLLNELERVNADDDHNKSNRRASGE